MRLHDPIPRDPTSSVTLVITSCGRLELLEKTLSTFAHWNTYPIRDVVIIEDSCNPRVYRALRNRYGSMYTLLLNEKKLGQIRSIDKAYVMVATEYVFHCEDDWKFIRKGFVEESISILESDEAILQVWLRNVQETLHTSDEKRYYYESGSFFRRVLRAKHAPESEKFWGGFSFNPGLRRMRDYRKIAPYAEIGHELEISMRYADLGYYAVCLDTPAVMHTGDGHHVVDITMKEFPRIAVLETYAINGLTRARLALVVRGYFRLKKLLHALGK